MKVNRAETVSALKKVMVGISSRETMEQSNCFIFQKKRVFTYNDEIAMSCSLDVGFEGAVVFEEFLNLLSKLKDDEVDITSDGKEVLVEGKKVRSGMAMEEEIKLPLLTDANSKKFKAVFPGMMEGIRAVAPYRSRNMYRPALTAVHVESDFIEACDGFQLARYLLKEGVEAGFLIPGNSLSGILGINPVKYNSSEKDWIHFEDENGLRLSVRKMEADFPDVSFLINSEDSGEEINFNSNCFDSIDRARIFSRHGAQEDDEYLEVAFQKGTMTIRSNNERGWLEEKIRTRFKGDLKFLANPGLLAGILDKDNTVTLYKDRMVSRGENIIFMINLIEEGGAE